MLGNVYFCKNIKVRNFLEKIMETVAFLAKIQYWHLKWYLETLLMGLHSKVPSWVAADLTDKVRCIKPVVPCSWLYGIAHEIPWCCAKLQELQERAQSLILSASDCPGVLFQDQQKVKTQASERFHGQCPCSALQYRNLKPDLSLHLTWERLEAKRAVSSQLVWWEIIEVVPQNSTEGL